MRWTGWPWLLAVLAQTACVSHFPSADNDADGDTIDSAEAFDVEGEDGGIDSDAEPDGDGDAEIAPEGDVDGEGDIGGDVDVEIEAEAEGTDDASDAADDTEEPEDAGPVCGNREVEEGEECDDGNVADGDGCEHDCRFTCHSGDDCGDDDVCTNDLCEAVGDGRSCRNPAVMCGFRAHATGAPTCCACDEGFHEGDARTECVDDVWGMGSDLSPIFAPPGTGLSLRAVRLTVDVTRPATELSVRTAVGFEIGDWILIIDQQGSHGPGAWDIVRVTDVGSGRLTVHRELIQDFSASDVVSVIKLPQYHDVTVQAGAVLRPQSAWDGNGGGILAFMVDGTLTVAGSLDATGMGYRGGAGCAGCGAYSCTAFQGEGSSLRSGTQTNVENSGGGGGAYPNDTGGSWCHPGAGGNATAGCNGVCETCSNPGGLGGQVIANVASRFATMGGGAGGYQSTACTPGGSGANGGGIIIVVARNVVLEGAGPHFVSVGAWTGDGQDGAGGSIVVLTPSTITIPSTAVNVVGGGSCGGHGVFLQLTLP